MKNLTIKRVIDVLGALYKGDFSILNTEISSIETDSRIAGPNSLFAAIPGEKVDGHDFINTAHENGAIVALAERIPKGCNCPVIVVKNTVEALGALAEFYRAQFKIPIIGITGSVGKTTMKEMVASVVSQRFCTHKTDKNFNNNLGVPLTVLKLNPEHEASVIEMGISHFGEMAQLGKIVRPEYAVYTNIGCAHLEFLGDYDGVLRAKSEMLRYVQPSGTVFINGDDETLAKLKCMQKLVRFGLSEGCDVSAENVTSLGAQGMSLTVVSGERRFDAKITSFGMHMVSAALGAAAVGIKLGLTDDEIAAGIAAYNPVDGRCVLEKTKKITIINDCYNANPTSTASALKSMSLLPGRRVAILGDMLELGSNELFFHRQIGELSASCGVQVLLTTGELSEATYEGAMDAGLINSQFFGSKDQLINSLPQTIKHGDVVLVKASHSRQFNQIVEALKKL